MVEKIKKYLSFAIIIALVIQSSPVGAMTFETTSKTISRSKIAKIEKLSNSLEMLAKSKLLPSIKKISDSKARSSLLQEYYIYTNLSKSLNSSIKYSYDDSYSEYLNKLRTNAKIYINLKNDVSTIASGGANPYLVSQDDIKTTESDILAMQNYLISLLPDSIDNLLSEKDIKQSGDYNFNFKSDFGSFSFNAKKYTSIVSFLTFSQEVSIDGGITFSVDKNEENGIPSDMSGSLNFDITFKKIGSDVYLTINSMTAKVNGVEELGIKAETSIDEELNKLVGNTYHIPLYDSGLGSMESVSKDTFKKILDTFKTVSILTPLKYTKNGIMLMPNTKFLANISEAVGEKLTNNDIIESRATLESEFPLYYINNGSSTVLKAVFPYPKAPEFSVAKSGSAYTFDFKIQDSEDITNYVKLHLQEGNTLIDISTIYAKFNYSLVGGILSSKLTSEFFPTFEATGKNTETDADISFKLGDEDIGYFKSKKDNAGKTTFDLNLSIKDIGKTINFLDTMSGKGFDLNFTGSYEIQKGTFSVDKPKTSIEIKDAEMPFSDSLSTQTAKARDTKRLADLNSIASNLKAEYNDSTVMPTSIDKILYSGTGFFDPLEGEVINGVTCEYTYELNSKTKTFTLSTCKEDSTGTDDNTISVDGSF